MLPHDMIGLKPVMEFPHGSNLRKNFLFLLDNLNMRILMEGLPKSIRPLRLNCLGISKSFWALSNRPKDWTQRQLVGTFIKGLYPDIRCEFRLANLIVWLLQFLLQGCRRRKLIQKTIEPTKLLLSRFSASLLLHLFLVYLEKLTFWREGKSNPEVVECERIESNENCGFPNQ